MYDALSSFGLIALTVVTVFAIRKRGLLVQLATEAALVAAISADLGLHGAAPIPLDGELPAGAAGAWLRALAVIWWLIAARAVVNVTLLFRGWDPRSRDARLFSDLVAAAIYITATLIILNSVLELPINALLATSGVIAIVLGLALQNTLGDVFSGIAVGLEKPFHPGDRVSLGNNIEGVIVEINWRSIRIRTDGEDLATIPNSIVAKGQMINRSVPTRRRAVTVEITIPSTEPSEKVLELLRQATLLCPDILAEPAPMLLLRRSGLYSATYAVTFLIPDSLVLLGAKSMLLRQARRFLHHAGISPSQTASNADVVASLVLFEALSADEAQALADQLVTHDVEAGDALFEQGSDGASIYIIQAGALELGRRGASSETEILGRVGPGEYIGELGLITGAARGVTMTALTHGRVLELPEESLRDLIQSNSALGAAMGRSVARGLALLDRDSAARSAAPEHGPDLLARIKAFFTQGAGAAR